MSIVTSEVLSRNAESIVHPVNLKRSQRIGEALGACSVVRLTRNLTFNDIFSGSVAIDEKSLIFDRQGERLDTTEILSQIYNKEQE